MIFITVQSFSAKVYTDSKEGMGKRTPWTAGWDLETVSRKTSLNHRSVRWNTDKFPRLLQMEEGEVVHFLQLKPKDRRLASEAWEEHATKQAAKRAPKEIHVISPSRPERKKDADGVNVGGFGIAMELPAGFGDGMGLRVEVEKLKQASAAARAQWADLVKDGHRDTPKAFAVWQQLLTAWTKLAKDAPAALTALDDSVSREIHEKTISATLQAVDRILRGLPSKIATSGQRLEAKQLEKICESEIEAARDALCTGRAMAEPIPNFEDE